MNAALADLDVAALLARLGAYPRRLTVDSRKVEPGVAFAACRGTAQDGRTFIPDALARGAAAVLWDQGDFAWHAEWRAPNVGVPNLAQSLGRVADFIYGNPSRDLWMCGVTGTNGKTTCTHWVAQALDACGRRSAVLGTLGNGLVGAVAPGTHTTPDACTLHELLRQLRTAGARAVAMEVSSHALVQGRVNGVKFDVALFTNLTRDHLDYHGTMAAYGAAKARLFAWPTLASAVINADDAFGRELAAERRRQGRKVVTYGLADADIRATAMRMTAEGLVLQVTTPAGAGEVAAQVVGAFNAQNLLGVLGVLLESGVPLPEALQALSALTPPAGRMQRLGGGTQPLVVVDYAHTPDALEKVLASLRPAVGPGRTLWAVFGAGGDRDKGKRPLMGRVAATLADRVVVTSDNPRGEEPPAIAEAIVAGIRESGHSAYAVELDRAAAITRAIGEAAPGDVVVVAGKGHEPYQEIAGRRVPFSDLAVAAAALQATERA